MSHAFCFKTHLPFLGIPLFLVIKRFSLFLIPIYNLFTCFYSYFNQLWIFFAQFLDNSWTIPVSYSILKTQIFVLNFIQFPHQLTSEPYIKWVYKAPLIILITFIGKNKMKTRRNKINSRLKGENCEIYSVFKPASESTVQPFGVVEV